MRGFANLPGLIKAYQSPYKGFNRLVEYINGMGEDEMYQSPYKGFNSREAHMQLAAAGFTGINPPIRGSIVGVLF